MYRTSLAAALTGVFVLASCTERFPKSTPVAEVYPSRANKVDILYVLTVGNSTHEYRRNILRAFSSLTAGIWATAGRSASLHVGLVSSEVGAGPYQQPDCVAPAGALLTKPSGNASCSAEETRPYLTLTDNETNITTGTGSALEKLQEVLLCRSYQVGCSLFGRVFLLEAGYLALSSGKNADFLRPDATLVVIYATDTLECSLRNYALFDPATQESSELGPYRGFRCFEYGFTCDQRGRAPGPRTHCVPRNDWLYPISRYVAQLRQLRPEGRVVLAGIGGPVDKIEVVQDKYGNSYLANDVCYEGGSQPALRLHALLADFPPVLFRTKCSDGLLEPSYDAFFSKVGREAGRRVGLMCTPKPPQSASCVVTLRSSSTQAVLPPCSQQTSSMCWIAAPNQACVRSGQELVIRGRIEDDAQVTITCT